MTNLGLTLLCTMLLGFTKLKFQTLYGFLTSLFLLHLLTSLSTVGLPGSSSTTGPSLTMPAIKDLKLPAQDFLNRQKVFPPRRSFQEIGPGDPQYVKKMEVQCVSYVRQVKTRKLKIKPLTTLLIILAVKLELLVMFTDSYDVIIGASKNEILNQYYKFGANIVFGAEDFCWPDIGLKSKYPEVGMKFLHSGGFIGPPTFSMTCL